MYLDEEVYDSQSGNLINTIEQSLICDGDSKEWLLRPKRFCVYGVNQSFMVAFTELVIPLYSSTSTVQHTPATWVKLEHAEELITILNDDSDGNSPTVVLPKTSPLVNSPLPKSSQKSPIPLSHPPPHVGHQRSLTIVDSLRRIWASKGIRNVFKTLDFDTLDIQRV
jgi:hypothetical protein